MKIRYAIFLVLGILIVITGDIFGTHMGWWIDYAWLLIVAAAFADPPELAAVAGLLFGLTLDGLSGGGTIIYTLGYGGFGAIIVFVRKTFFLDGLISGWIVAIAGAQVLWLFIGLLSQASLMMGITATPPGWLSPFLLSVLIGYPFTWLIVRRILPGTPEMLRPGRYGMA